MEVKMSKLKSSSSLMVGNGFKDSFLKNSAISTKKYDFLKSKLTIPNTQEIEERVSKSFLAIDVFATEINGKGSGSGGSGTGSGSGSGTGSGGGSGGGW
jgi:hypothetical protein